MLFDKAHLSEIVSMAQIFWMEHHRWPKHAAELSTFSERLKIPLDFSGFHLLTFFEKGKRELVVEFALEDSGKKTATCGRLELRNAGQGNGIWGWWVRHIPLPDKQVKKTQYCLIPQAR